jgi:hypothetical protein
MRDVLCRLGDTWMRPYMPAAVSVHDAILLDVPREKEEAAIADLSALMTEPIARMGGLQIGVEVEVGDNWLDMQKVAKVPMLDGHNGLVGAASPTVDQVA